MRAAALAACVAAAASHSVVIIPKPRNAVDSSLPMWQNGSFPKPDNSPGCTTNMGVCGCWCSNGTAACESGQTCFWFNQGCTIGCDECTGVNARAQVDICGKGAKAVVCDPRLRTYNKGAACNSAKDIYRHNPWRAPNTAPVFDPCGKAGGGYPDGGKSPGPGAAMFTNTTNAKFGDLGSVVLKPMPSQATWHAGSVVETMWGLRSNHGGGYLWRLCPKTEKLSEACFKAHPLPFVGHTQLQYEDGHRQLIDSAYTYENGTGVFTADNQLPTGITWAMNPLPDEKQKGSVPSRVSPPGNTTEFPAPCKNDTDPNAPTGWNKAEGLCSGERPFHVSVVDALRIPEETPPGEYVLGWRWDVEETAQVWTSCSDISVAPKL